MNWNAVQTEEIERVEVVRGPFSALYGRNAMGGVVNVLTRPVVGRTFEAFGRRPRDVQRGVAAGAEVLIADRERPRLGEPVGVAYGESPRLVSPVQPWDARLHLSGCCVASHPRSRSCCLTALGTCPTERPSRAQTPAPSREGSTSTSRPQRRGRRLGNAPRLRGRPDLGVLGARGKAQLAAPPSTSTSSAISVKEATAWASRLTADRSSWKAVPGAWAEAPRPSVRTGRGRIVPPPSGCLPLRRYVARVVRRVVDDGRVGDDCRPGRDPDPCRAAAHVGSAEAVCEGTALLFPFPGRQGDVVAPDDRSRRVEEGDGRGRRTRSRVGQRDIRTGGRVLGQLAQGGGLPRTERLVRTERLAGEGERRAREAGGARRNRVVNAEAHRERDVRHDLQRTGSVTPQVADEVGKESLRASREGSGLLRDRSADAKAGLPGRREA
ncbi:MAG: TonB-dependent receptor plug domain-containing protein [Holophagales bacterium]|nr:TonB-dependent receptor plug domain-containing protein [Holophagales bacterium]